MKKWAVKDMAEFLQRQAGFDFAIVTDAVMTIASEAKRAMWSHFDKWIKAFKTQSAVKQPEQLRLDLLGWMRLPVMA